MIELSLSTMDMPLGRVLIATKGRALCALDFEDFNAKTEARLTRRFGAVSFIKDSDPLGIRALLGAYLEGEIAAIDTLDVDPGGTPFQARVWAELRRIPAGRPCSYGDLARAIGQPTAVRAVGGANGRNPIALVIPCHRVIASDGSLGGYSSGLERKRWLLQHEESADLTPR